MAAAEQAPFLTLVLLGLLLLWIISIKGYALWTAAKRGEKGWFIFFLFFQTLGILELIYIYWAYRQAHQEIPTDTAK